MASFHIEVRLSGKNENQGWMRSRREPSDFATSEQAKAAMDNLSKMLNGVEYRITQGGLTK
jgi:hypothetical protein